MNICQNCGQANSTESNFCRFCGKSLNQAQNSNYDFAPPRPYVWKTDEFQVKHNQARKTGQYQQVQPLAGNNNFAAQPLARQNPQFMAHGFRCPRCNTQMMPRIEKKISTAGWIVFAVLLVMFFPLFWIGFLIKDEVRVCSVCGLQVG